jgi:hypothetical protein
MEKYRLEPTTGRPVLFEGERLAIVVEDGIILELFVTKEDHYVLHVDRCGSIREDVEVKIFALPDLVLYCNGKRLSVKLMNEACDNDWALQEEWEVKL